MINQLQTISKKLNEIETQFKDLGNGYRDWVSKQSFPVEATVVTTSGAIQGAAFGGLIGAVAQVAAHVFPQHSHAIKAFSSCPMAEARNIAAMEGARAGINCIMKRIRRKEDVHTRMAAGFGAGVTFELLTSTGNPHVAVNAAILGVIGALVGGVIFELGQKSLSCKGSMPEQGACCRTLAFRITRRTFRKAC